MSDRELLELAAKAAGIELEYCPVSGFHWVTSKYSGLWWDPLNVDGDAFRLAVKLQLILEPSLCQCNTIDYQHFGHSELTDPFAAMRYAITQCAARLGASLA